jgi:rubrerythrin
MVNRRGFGPALERKAYMKIKRIISQHRRDFRADYECEHCGFIGKNQPGYDDANFHRKVIPDMKCPECHKTAGDDYRPLPTKYPEGMTV